MRGEYVLELIKYHYEKENEKFDFTVKNIINNEEKKGNIKISEKISALLNNSEERNYKENIESQDLDYGKGFYTYGPSSGLVMKNSNKLAFQKDKSLQTNLASPKDKSSQNNLFDLSFPNSKDMSELLLPEEIKEKVMEMTLEYRNREMLKELNLKTENRLLLCGPPGCGKTSTAYYISNVLGLPLAYVRLDSLVTSLLGQTGTNIRKIFESVGDKEIILFLDEFDAIAKKRDDNHELGELKRVVNTLLQNIDLLPENVFLIAATNHQSLLDKAVWRRFNTVLYLDNPDDKLREVYIKNLLSNFNNKLVVKVDYLKVSNLCKGLSFANIHEMINKTIKKCLIHENKQQITTKDITESLLNSILLYNKSNVDIEKLRELRENGLNLREISELTSIPRSTLSDWMKK
ncbi:AAA family ATPase [Priestia megaterium]